MIKLFSTIGQLALLLIRLPLANSLGQMSCTSYDVIPALIEQVGHCRHCTSHVCSRGPYHRPRYGVSPCALGRGWLRLEPTRQTMPARSEKVLFQAELSNIHTSTMEAELLFSPLVLRRSCTLYEEH